ncbi:hypothetical protein FM111_00165 [Brevundimonas diminuta 3F5N]|uniref:Uncharacterized protein n=1 Tax=Brevundimonas diminuta 3F5N TaxID=1255603 RepID=A0A1R4EQ97_BREDI|nr:hypothetical protein FM111_00165 [Brevundimonas diminuta 3F5N]
MTGTVDGAAFAGDPVRKDLGAVFTVEGDDLGHRSTDCERATDDRAGAGSGDQVKSPAEIERLLAPDSGELVGKAREKSGGVDATHPASVEAQHTVGFLNPLLLFAVFHPYRSTPL